MHKPCFVLILLIVLKVEIMDMIIVQGSEGFMKRRMRYGLGRAKVRGSGRRSNTVSFAPVILMMCLSIGCGYAAARYVVEPVVNYVPEITAKTSEVKSNEYEGTSSSEIIEDEADVGTAKKVDGYALQFGCYSGKASAEAAMNNMKMPGLQIIEQNNMYKIIGEILKTKEAAKKALAQLPDGTEAFVTEIYK